MLSATNQALHSSLSQSEDNILILYVKDGMEEKGSNTYGKVMV